MLKDWNPKDSERSGMIQALSPEESARRLLDRKSFSSLKVLVVSAKSSFNDVSSLPVQRAQGCV